MQKFIKILFSAITLAAGISILWINPAIAFCNPNSLASNSAAVAVSTASNLELGNMLSLTNNYTVTSNSNFSDFKLVCTLGGETLYYRNGIEGGYTVKFTAGDQDYYIKFTASLPITSKAFTPLIREEYPASDFDTDITITAELTEATAYEASTSTGSVEVPVLYFLSNKFSTAYPTASALRGLVATKAVAAAMSREDLKGFSSFNISFSPVSTTCNIENQQFTLPSTTLFTLKSGDYSDTRFSIPLSCSGSIDSKATKTFNLRAYSNDIVDSANYIVRNASSTSSGIGFQLFNTLSDPLKFTTGYDSASTSLAAMTKGKDLVSSLTSIDIGARYKIFDKAKASPGTVVGTIIIYMEYE